MRVGLVATPGGGVTVAVALPDSLAARAANLTESDPTGGSDAAPATVPSPVAARRFGGARPVMPAGPTVGDRPLADPGALPVSGRTAEVVTAPAASPLRSMPAVAPAVGPSAPAPPPIVPVAPAAHVATPPTPAAPPEPAPPLRPAAPEPEPVLRPVVFGDQPAPAAASESLFGGPPLTQRVPQASLDPRMRAGRAEPDNRKIMNGLGGRSPEELRAQLSKFQAAQARARDESNARGASTNGDMR